MHNQMIRGHSMWPCIIQGVLNRRFKRVFAYFWRGPKVGAESGAAQVPGQFEKNLPFAAEGGEEKKILKSIGVFIYEFQ